MQSFNEGDIIQSLEECEHCWHSHGGGTSYGHGGRQSVRCCYCGISGVRPWTTNEIPVDGHGKYHKMTEVVYGEVEIYKR